jgi:DNA polymerase-3 subunit delta
MQKYAKVKFTIVLGKYIMSKKETSILKEIKNGIYHNSYFLSGNNEYASAEIIQLLKKAVLSPGFESFDLEQFDGASSSFDMGELKRAFHTPPMASGKRLTILTNIDKLSDADRKALLLMLASPAETGMLIMISNPASKARSGFYQKLRALARSEELKKPKKYPLLRWIKEYVKQFQCSIDEDAAQVIVEHLGEDQVSLSGEIEKMVTYVGKKRRIAREDAFAVITSNMVNTVFDLTEAVGRRRKNEALSVLTYLLDWGELPEKILGVLRSFFIRLRGLFFYKQRGVLKNDIAKKMGIMFFIVNKELSYASNFTEEELKQRLELLYDAEARIKSGEEAQFILTDLVYNLI